MTGPRFLTCCAAALAALVAWGWVDWRRVQRTWAR
jgi:hypothetical protein